MCESVLITIGFSHYCEKARWALDHHRVAYREDVHAPLFHLTATLPAARQRTVPILVTAQETFADSTDIVAFADRMGSGERLFPEDAKLCEEVSRWEEELDQKLGPASRRYLYYLLMPSAHFARSYMIQSGPAWQRQGMKLAFPLVRRMIVKGYGIDDRGAGRSLARIEDVFGRVEEALSDGRRYLTGDTFTAADLTFASLAAPLVFPAEYGFALPKIEEAPAAVGELVHRFRETAAGEFVMRLYAEDRSRAETDPRRPV